MGKLKDSIKICEKKETLNLKRISIVIWGKDLKLQASNIKTGKLNKKKNYICQTKVRKHNLKQNIYSIENIFWQ